MREVPTALRKRQEIARHLNQKFSPVPGVKAIFVHGSVASSWVDEQSDVDMTVVCADSILALPLRQSILSSLREGWTFQDASLDNAIWAQCDSDGCGTPNTGGQT